MTPDQQKTVDAFKIAAANLNAAIEAAWHQNLMIQVEVEELEQMGSKFPLLILQGRVFLPL